MALIAEIIPAIILFLTEYPDLPAVPAEGPMPTVLASLPATVTQTAVGFRSDKVHDM